MGGEDIGAVESAIDWWREWLIEPPVPITIVPQISRRNAFAKLQLTCFFFLHSTHAFPRSSGVVRRVARSRGVSEPGTKLKFIVDSGGSE